MANPTSRNRIVYIISKLYFEMYTCFCFRYGDVTPRSVPGRIIAMIWTLIGLVLVGILTGALTSTVTTLTIPPAAKLYDTNVSCIEYFKYSQINIPLKL